MALLVKSEKSNCGVLHFYPFTLLPFYPFTLFYSFTLLPFYLFTFKFSFCVAKIQPRESLVSLVVKFGELWCVIVIKTFA